MFNMTPEMRDFLLHMGGGLLMGGRNNAEAVGRGLLMGVQGRNEGKVLRDREKTNEQERAYRQSRMDEEARQRQEQEQIRGLAGRAFAPPQMAPNDPYEAHQTPGGGGMPEFARGLMSINPMMGAQMMPKPQAPLKLNKNERLLDPATHREIVGAAPEPQPDWMNPAYQKFQMDKAAAGRPQVSVNNLGEREEQKELGKLRVQNFSNLQGLAASARKENSLLSGLEKIPLETGKLTPANATVAAWLTAAGAKSADLNRIASGAQTFEAFTSDLVMQQQLAQKGPQTESDAKRLEMTQARLSNTPEANKLNISYRKAMNKRTIEQERFYADWGRKKGTLDGADDAWFAGKGGTSIWDEPELKQFQSAGGGNVIDFNQLPSGRPSGR